MPAVKAPPVQLKDWFDAARYRAIAKDLAALAPKFDRKRFLALTLDGLAARSLMERMRQTAIAIDAALPGTYREKIAVLRPLAPTIQHGFVAIVLCDFVARHGLDDFDASMDALQFFTRFGSAEFAVRPFLIRDQARALAAMQIWACNPNEHVRRLASEGCRPRLPWGQRLPDLVRDPSPLAPILDVLKDDPSLYVRTSVANNLNDITKDHPEWVIARLESWDRTQPNLAWIAKRAARTLVKRGNARALALFGAGAKAAVRATLAAQPARLKLGDRLTLTATITATITATTKTSQRLLVDYVVHYVKANGSASAKVFKWSEFDLAPRATVTLTKRQVIRDFTTRRHFAGRHVVELQINGRRSATTAFLLSKAS